jgi:PAS domain S-box-containing protein
MVQRARVSLFGYGVAVASVTIAFVLRVITAPFLLEHAPLLAFVAAILVTAAYGGLGPGLLATGLSVFAAGRFYAPLNSFQVDDPADAANLALFAGVGVLTSLLCEKLHRYRANAARQAGLLEQVHDAIITWRPDGAIQYWNAAAERQYGIPRSDAAGRNVHELLRTVHDRGFSSVLRTLEEQGEWSGELTQRTRAGNPVEVSSRMVMLEERGSAVVLEVDRDISDRRRREELESEALRRRTAVYELIERLQHARSASEVYGAALVAIRDALRCSRASILLFDGDGVMRFVASAGLSEGYRRAVDGHSPWKPDARDPEPIVVPDLVAADMDESLRSVIRGEGIAALAFVPLISEDRLIGKIMAYFDAPHEFSREEIDAALAVARELAFGIQRARADELLRASEERLAREAVALERLNEHSADLWRAATLEDGLQRILDAAIELLGAERGNVQLWDSESDSLRIAAQRGFEPEFLEHFREVRAGHPSVCGQASRDARRSVVGDVEAEPRLAVTVPVFRAAGVRAVQSTPLRHWDGTPIGMVSTYWSVPHMPAGQELHRLDLYLRTATDFIVRCRADEALRREIEERQLTETRLQERAGELETATAKLRENDRRKNEFLATLGHELRNPLAPLTTGLELLRRLGLPEDAENVRGMMERQVGAMARLVDDLLDVNRITTGRLRLQRERLPLSMVLQRAIETVRPLVEEREHRLSVSIEEDVPLDADPTRLCQVFVALLNNAAKYTDSGGAIAVETRRHGPAVVVTVRDSGRGIAASEIPNLFQMFARTSRAVESGEPGLGVGLSLARSLVEMHGGTIDGRSDGPGRGCEFRVRLPVAPPEALAAAPASEKRRLLAAGLRVLVVDDNRDAAASLALLLETMGNDVRTAHDGEQAAVVASEFQPDVALLDIGMPKLDGYEAARRIRRESNGRPVRLIALTGYGQEGDRRKSQEAGFDRHLVKPLRPQALLDLLAEIERGETLSPRPPG